ncbi:adenylate/guanylate cyclase domain-containing protein [Leptospira yasudae]|uniref:Adenylate/guanylate cyclase domain-containing protein n=1 Tax=Leptospira yasudae TaxID=2202201 RepID=A0ABX9M4E6_9LEPT|nr:adenylate/guanylate cyclase domain-containing protein [Leptospira yasudae]MBW0433908.1 adenylate/guanylate cyclase domain-containing protein [Leptospira yasudae]RHX80613.1 adenylate/guanylate cyclase domain-containing protein [Leptospira yasudae]TGK24319.1 HAMP domain-containing protein [Leptospira yasudae]TGM05893.1 HAMP domain-containing protein [Leptospira yasudae]
MNSFLNLYNWNIRQKLMVIISFIILVSLGVIIALATYFFKSDNEVRIKENNLKLTDVISQKVRSDMASLTKRSLLLARAVANSEGSNDILQNDEDIFYLKIFRKENGDYAGVKRIVNESSLKELKISPEESDKIVRKYLNGQRKAQPGKPVVLNVSPDFQKPVLYLMITIGDGVNTAIVISLVKMDSILDSFKTSGITQFFLVGQDGKLIAHSDPKLILQPINLSDDPIVKNLLDSTMSNGQTRYKGKDNQFYLGSFRRIGYAGLGVISSTSEKKAFEEVYNIQKRNIYLMIVVVNVSILFVFFYSRRLTRPILKLVDASKEIEKGNFHLTLEPESGDEIGKLTSSFVEMGKGLSDRDKMKDAFGKFVNKDIAEMVLKGEVKLGGDKRECVILFSDIRSFTSISERIEPELVVEFLNQYFTAMVKCINANGGSVNKYIGDAIMAVWGELGHTDSDTENAINAALDMRKSLLQFNKGRGTDKKPRISIGIGINTGEVIAGQIGSEDRLEYTVIGDTVNLASRVESLTKEFGADILITGNSYEKVKGIYNVEKLKPIKVKGKQSLQTIYAVLGPSKDKNCPKNLKELRKQIGLEFKSGGSK